jgi:ketosteroid isomerase-like protein
MDPILQRLVDEDAIRRITDFYSDAITHLDAARAASIYTEDGIVEIVGHRTSGRDAIEAGMRQSFAAFELLRMIAHGGIIEVDGDSARARWSTIEVGLRRGSSAMHVIFGRYEDALVRRPDGQPYGWRFRQRSFTLAGRTQIDTAKLQLNPDFYTALSSGAMWPPALR